MGKRDFGTNMDTLLILSFRNTALKIPNKKIAFIFTFKKVFLKINFVNFLPN